MRSIDCLAQAVYYEARSESEDGQRAVAQVVLNRVRHPAWPNSVCGVVYQGPMRPGGGCQFTFTCDGSLATRRPAPRWDEARRIAAEALGGRTYAPVGLPTHYHTNAVFPAWAPQLVKTNDDRRAHLLPPAGPRRRAGRVRQRLCRQRALPAPVDDPGRASAAVRISGGLAAAPAVRGSSARGRRRRLRTSRRTRAGPRTTCPIPASARTCPVRPVAQRRAGAVTGR